MPEAEAIDEGVERINIVISRYSLNRLDQLKEAGGLVSRGKTVEETVEIVTELKQQLLATIALSKGKPVSSDDIRSVVSWILPRLSKVISSREFQMVKQLSLSG